MVILERWKPIIADTFPSSISFLIKIKGLPLHFRDEDMICRIGKELETLEKHELTKTSARVRVSVNSLKPLVKETIIELDSGEECKVTLEYERLQNHCSNCLLLSHHSEHFPSRVSEQSLMVYPHVEKETEQAIQATEDNSYHQSRKYSPVRGPDHMKKVMSSKKLQAEVDRHDKVFGKRLSTIHTCNPLLVQQRPLTIPTQRRRGGEENEKQAEYISPPYTKSRRHHPYESSHRRLLFLHRNMRE